MAKEKIVAEELTPEEQQEMKDLESIQDKIDKGEELSPEEQALLGKEDAPEGDQEVTPEETDESKETSDAEKKDDDAEKEEGEDKDKETKPADEAKKESDAAQKDDAEITEEVKQKVADELDKPEEKQDLSKFNKNETALYWDLKRERRSRQKAEAERDLLRFEKAKDQKPEEKAKEDKDDLFEGKEDDEFLSVAEAKKLVEKLQASSKQQPGDQIQQDPIQRHYIKICDERAREIYDDYEEVLECGKELLDNTPVYQMEIAKSVYAGKNPAIVAYHLIKGDPDFPKVLPIAQARIAAAGKKPSKKEPAKKEDKVDPAKAKKAKETEDKIEKNTNKVKTSGHFSGGGESATGEFTEDQVLNMSDAEFAALPKKTRDSFLTKFGV